MQSRGLSKDDITTEMTQIPVKGVNLELTPEANSMKQS